MNDAMKVERAPAPKDILNAGWFFHQGWDRRLNQDSYVIPVTWFAITNNPAPGLGEKVMATEVFQVGDLAIPARMALYQHLITAHNRMLPSEARPRNPLQPRRNGKFVKASELAAETAEKTESDEEK